MPQQTTLFDDIGGEAVAAARPVDWPRASYGPHCPDCGRRLPSASTVCGCQRMAAAAARPRSAHAAPPPEYWWEPRPDLTSDTGHWRQLLRAAYLVDGEQATGLYGALHALRCCGARLAQRAEEGAWRLEPGPAYFGEWRAECREWLGPHRAALAALLASLELDGAVDG